MKKILTAALAILFCLTATAHPLKTRVAARVAHHQSPKGKLFLRASIFRGLNLSWLFLGDDGTFVIDPKNGADPVNYALERQNNADNVGKYTQSGNKIIARYDKGNTREWAVDYQNGKLNTIDGLYSSLATSMPAGYKLSGDYTWTALLANVGTIQTFTFSTDGTFKLHGMGAVNTPQTSAISQENKGGTYSISGNTLRLSYNTGEKSVALIGIYQNSYIVLNNNYFKKS